MKNGKKSNLKQQYGIGGVPTNCRWRRRPSKVGGGARDLSAEAEQPEQGSVSE